jgi:hypothetical protein
VLCCNVCSKFLVALVHYFGLEGYCAGKSSDKQLGSILQIKRIRRYIPNVVIGWGPESGNVALCGRYERCCFTGFFKWCVEGSVASWSSRFFSPASCSRMSCPSWWRD